MSFCPGTSDVIMSFRLVDTFGLLNPLIEFCYGWGAREPLFPARLLIQYKDMYIMSTLMSFGVISITRSLIIAHFLKKTVIDSAN